MSKAELNKCALWEETKRLGRKRNLDVDNEMLRCRAINLCDGTNCIYLSPEKADEERLEELREQLKNV
jgi:hypothetical protein